ncbi:Uncharacterised protein [uncultured Flavonifractor sp.]|nr:Uncharacterised protein [Flavonifractor plautii]SCJ23261.1 Uncharacterised protein [uncultured Flavonifractor sp.]
MKITRLAFNLWNGYGTEQPDSAQISPFFLPDELFCCVFQPYSLRQSICVFRNMLKWENAYSY